MVKGMDTMYSEDDVNAIRVQELAHGRIQGMRALAKLIDEKKRASIDGKEVVLSLNDWHSIKHSVGIE